MAFKRNVLPVVLAAGLFLSPLSGCNGDKSGPGDGEGSSTEIITQDERKTALEELGKVQTALLGELGKVQTALEELEYYTQGMDPNRTVKYSKAKAKVDAVYTAYQEFRDNLSEDIKTKIDFSNVDGKVE